MQNSNTHNKAAQVVKNIILVGLALSVVAHVPFIAKAEGEKGLYVLGSFIATLVVFILVAGTTGAKAKA